LINQTASNTTARRPSGLIAIATIAPVVKPPRVGSRARAAADMVVVVGPAVAGD
jgi:hypothetical protein